MKTCIFHGPDTALGRFGVVTEGDHIQLLESEYACISTDPRFDCISRRKPARPIFPLGTPPYDLRQVRWEHADVYNWLVSQGRTQLGLIISALDLLGVPLVHTVHDPETHIADLIYGEVKDLGWTKLTEEERKACGVFAAVAAPSGADAPPAPESPVSDAPSGENVPPEADPDPENAPPPVKAKGKTKR